jgi:tetratricopeptide (TPR) repeat protein
MNNKLLHLLEIQLEKVIELNTTNALDELTGAYLLLNDFPKAINLIERSLKINQDREYMRSSNYTKMVKYVIRAGDRETFNAIEENIESNYRGIYLAVLDLKHKNYTKAFKGLSNIDEDDYEFEADITELIKDVLPRSIRLFPIEVLMKGLPTKSLKNQILNDYSKLAFKNIIPSKKKEIIKIFKKYADKEDKKSYINDYSALIFAKENNDKKSIKYAEKACDLRELGLLRDIANIFKQNNDISTAIKVASLAVEKSKKIDWMHYSFDNDLVFAQSQQSQYLAEHLFLLCDLQNDISNHKDVVNTVKQIHSAIDNMPEVDHFGEWKIYQYFSFIEFGIKINDIELVKNIIEKCLPLESKYAESLTSNTDTTILKALSHHTYSLSNNSINQFIKLISKSINDRGNDFNTLVSWSELLVTLNKTEQARKLTSYLLKSIKNKDDFWTIYDIAPKHYNLHNSEEIEELFIQIGTLRSTYYLHAVAKSII